MTKAASRRTSSSNEAGIKVIIQAVEKAGYKLGKQIYLGMDVASSEFYKKGKYDLHGEGRKFTSPEFVKYLAKLAAKYPIISIEDGMAEQDWDGLGDADQRARQEGAARGRRPVRHQHEDPARKASTRGSPIPS